MQSNRFNNQYATGMSLIELMIVVAIIGILAAIGIPGYQNYVTESRRGVAQAEMVELSAVLERFFTDNNSYVAFPLGDAAGNMFPDHLPSDTPHANRTYDLAVNNATLNGYTLVATPTAGGAQAGDGFLQYTSTGAKAWDTNDDGAIAVSEENWHN